MLPFFDQDHLTLRAQVREWVANNLDRREKQRHNIEEQARALVKQLGKDGFLAYAVPQRFDDLAGHLDLVFFLCDECLLFSISREVGSGGGQP